MAGALDYTFGNLPRRFPIYPLAVFEARPSDQKFILNASNFVTFFIARNVNMSKAVRK
jgi:hypothetical protein